jgi:23S rRNA pseudouridine1911/1915/1917 synthase
MEDYQEEKEEFEDDGLFEHFRISVDQGQSQLRIDKFLTNRLNHISRSKIQAAAEAGNILVNGISVKANYTLSLLMTSGS